jgi:chromate transporter
VEGLVAWKSHKCAGVKKECQAGDTPVTSRYKCYAVPDETEPQLAPVSMRQLAAYFLKLGTLGFGGPIALAGYMQRDLVERRRWISEEDYKRGLALAQLAPGPLAAQLAMYLGWVRGRFLGATLVSLAFILPSFVMVLGLAYAYVQLGGLSWMQGLFYGIGAAVIAIIARSVQKLTKLTLAKDPLLWVVFVANGAVTALTESEIIWVFVASGVLVYLVRIRPRIGAHANVLMPWSWWVTGLNGPADLPLLWKIGLYFAEAGAFVFGSGLAIVPFLHGGVVEQNHWLTERQFLDAVAVAMITPGPVVITVAFIGFLVAGFAGAGAAAIGVFLPCFLFVVIPAPYFHRIADNKSIKAFVDGVSAAAAGAIGGAAIVLGRRAIFDVPTIIIAAVTFAVLFKVKKLPEPLVIIAAGLVGLVLTSCHQNPQIDAPAPGSGLPLVKVADVPLPGGQTRFDYQDIDATKGLLVVAHMNDDSVLILSLADGSVKKELPNIPTPRGIAVASDIGKIFVTSSPNQLVIIDSKTLSEVGRVTTGSSPDGVAWDPDDQLVGVSDQGDGALSLLTDGGNGTSKAVALGSETGNVVYDATRKHFWITVVGGSSPSELVEVDPKARAITTRIALPGCDGAHGLRIHPDGHSAFVACEDNDRLVRVGLDERHAVVTGACGRGSDVLSIDSNRGWLYVAAESGDLTVWDITKPGLVLVGHDHPGTHSHTVVADPASHRVFFPLPEGPVLRIMKPSGT